ncbi:hypothetical protein MHK_008202, partial [Candidatus Magnetomorum sp. HK-1]
EPVTMQTVESMNDVITQNTIVFNFYTLDATEPIHTYTATYTQYKSDIDRESQKTLTQSLFEKSSESGGVYGEKTLYKANGETTFYPLMGTTLHLTVKDVHGKNQNLEITIPPIPLKNLILDHADNMTYDLDGDRIILENPGFNIQTNDFLKAVVTYYTFGGDAIGTGVQLSFEMAEGTYKGSTVLYNPIVNGERLALNSNAPFVGLPMLLNPESELYEQIMESPELWIYIEEKGDLSEGFRAEKLLVDAEVNSEGIVYIKMNHLTAVGLGIGEMPGAEIEPKEVECMSCEKTSSC